MRLTCLLCLFVACVLLIAPNLQRPTLGQDATTPHSAAAVFLGSLTNDQRMQTARSFEDPKRENWHFVPRKRQGVAIKELDDTQQQNLEVLLKTCLSDAGHEKAIGAITLEGVLAELGGDPDYRDAGKYHVLIFGEPGPSEPWGLRFEGHHLSLNYTFIEGKAHTSIAPAFIGANPHVVPRGKHKNLRLLAAEEDLGRALMHALNQEQRAKALIAPKAPKDILTGAHRVAMLERFEGIPADQLDEAQTVALTHLIDCYLDNHQKSAADAMRERIRVAGFENIYFAWAGSTEPKKAHYYRVHGPTFLIEYDNVQGGANHSHTVLRDIENDFGRDWLGEHHHHAH